MIAMIKKELKQTLSIVTLFEYPTIAALAARLTGESAPATPQAHAASAATRGRQRRYHTRMQQAN
jgi:hypothetical protein